jgi:hypothetical protein
MYIAQQFIRVKLTDSPFFNVIMGANLPGLFLIIAWHIMSPCGHWLKTHFGNIYYYFDAAH